MMFFYKSITFLSFFMIKILSASVKVGEHLNEGAYESDDMFEENFKDLGLKSLDISKAQEISKKEFEINTFIVQVNDRAEEFISPIYHELVDQVKKEKVELVEFFKREEERLKTKLDEKEITDSDKAEVEHLWTARMAEFEEKIKEREGQLVKELEEFRRKEEKILEEHKEKLKEFEGEETEALGRSEQERANIETRLQLLSNYLNEQLVQSRDYYQKRTEKIRYNLWLSRKEKVPDPKNVKI